MGMEARRPLAPAVRPDGKQDRLTPSTRPARAGWGTFGSVRGTDLCPNWEETRSGEGEGRSESASATGGIPLSAERLRQITRSYSTVRLRPIADMTASTRIGQLAVTYDAIVPRCPIPRRRVITGAVSGKASMAPMPTKLTAKT